MTVVEHLTDDGAAAFHARELPAVDSSAPGTPRLWWFWPHRSAVVLGSTQDRSLIDQDAAGDLGLDVVRRRSGGGVVVVGPGRTLWLDVVVPRGHRLWDDDVARATWWIGDVWADVLGSSGLAAASVHRGAMVTSSLARLVCFAGRGPGEVFVGEAKAVGISQRRTRDWARFQCALSLQWDADLHVAVIRDLHEADRPNRRDAVAGLGTTFDIGVLDLGRLVDDLTAAFVARLDS